MDIKNKIAIVTGASHGIGLAITKSLLDEGVRVAAWNRSEMPVKHENLLFVPTDISHSKEVSSAMKRTLDHFGKEIHILINNAGFGHRSLLEDTPEDIWKNMFAVNVDGVFYCSKSVIPLMKARGEGHILNVASVAGTLGVHSMAGYSATKHAVKGLSHSMFLELRDFGIKVSCLYPGSVKTNFFDSIRDMQGHDNMMMPEDIASTVIHILKSPPNYHLLDVEVRPLRPKG